MLVSEVFNAVGADTRGQAVSPTIGTAEWNQWLSWANEELRSHGEVHDWIENTHPHHVVSLGQSGTSLAMPDNFKKMSGSLSLNGVFYTEVDSDQFDKYDSTNNVFRVGYNGGWYLEVKPPSTSGATGYAPHIGYHTSLATATDRIVMRNPYYLVKRLKSRIFKYRQDPIFTEIESEADIMLQQMLENEYYKHSQYRGGATTTEEETGFVLGQD